MTTELATAIKDNNLNKVKAILKQQTENNNYSLGKVDVKLENRDYSISMKPVEYATKINGDPEILRLLQLFDYHETRSREGNEKNSASFKIQQKISNVGNWLGSKAGLFKASTPEERQANIFDKDIKLSTTKKIIDSMLSKEYDTTKEIKLNEIEKNAALQGRLGYIMKGASSNYKYSRLEQATQTFTLKNFASSR